MVRLFILVTLFIGVVTIVSCSSATVQPTATTQPTTAPVQPTATTQPTATPVQPTATTQPTKASTTPTSQSSASGQLKLNLDDYMPKGAGRDLLLQNCTGCHSFAPIITGQRTQARWESIRVHHRDAMLALNDKDYNAIYDFLEENFNNTKPEPKLPDWFVQSQTGTGE